MKKGCLGCLYAFVLVTIAAVALIGTPIFLDHVRGEGGRDLARAARAGDVERVSELLGFGRSWFVDVNRGALGSAASEGHAEVAALLIEAGADVNRGALRSAASEGHAEVAALLIQAGADVDVGPLYAAAENGHAEMVSLLIEAGADVNRGFNRGARSELGAAIVNALNAFGNPSANRVSATAGSPTYHPAALHAAIAAGHTDVAALLIDAGANVLEPASGHPGYENAVELAELEGRAEMIELLAAAPERPMAINVINAAQRGDWERLARVVARGAEVNEPERSDDRTDGWTALMFAAEAGRVDMVSTLLDRGADVNHSSPSSDTALTIAVANGHEAVVERLRAAGAEEREVPPT